MTALAPIKPVKGNVVPTCQGEKYASVSLYKESRVPGYFSKAVGRALRFRSEENGLGLHKTIPAQES
jgi:hypothetical protein